MKEHRGGALRREADLISGDQRHILRMLQERLAILTGLARKSLGGHIIGLFDKGLSGSVELGKYLPDPIFHIL